MEIEFRKLVSLLEIDAPVYFTPRDKMNRQNYVFCQFMGDAEQEAIQLKNHNPDLVYNTDGMGLHFPDIGIEEYYSLEMNRNPIAVNLHINSIRDYSAVSLHDIPFVYSLYCILHEYGHWLYFLNTGMKPFDYCNVEMKLREKSEKTAQSIYNMPDWDPYKIILVTRYEKEIYSKIQSESFADQYALDHIAESIEIARVLLRDIE